MAPRGRDGAQRGDRERQRHPGQGGGSGAAQDQAAGTAELLEREAERLGQRIDCLSRNRDAILGYLATVRGSL